MSDQTPYVGDLLKDSPRNWGRWGPDDEVGSLNFLTAAEVLRGVGSVVSGEVFTLQVQMGRTEAPGDPIWPGRSSIKRENVMDEGYFQRGEGDETPGGAHYSDDKAELFLQASTQYDALGHVWYDGQVWNGFDAEHTVGGMKKASVLPIAERGVVGRGILLDVARHRGKAHLAKGETFTHEDLLEVAAAQGVTIEKHDVLVIRTGWIGHWYETTPEEFYADFKEPGLTYSPELVSWFHEMEIPNLVTDTIANEVTFEPDTGVTLPLHSALMRNLGVTFTEIAWLEDLASACAADGRWTFLYTAGPLKVVEGTGAPVNPVVVR